MSIRILIEPYLIRSRWRRYNLLFRIYHLLVSSIIYPRLGLHKLLPKRYWKEGSYLLYVSSHPSSHILPGLMTDIQPPAGYQIPPSLAPTPAPTNTSPVIGKRTVPAPGKSLIDRYGLSARIPSADKGKGKEDESGTPTGQPGQGQGVGKWEGSKEERERGLRERKEKMVLEARR
jgi:hypothetical protein